MKNSYRNIMLGGGTGGSMLRVVARTVARAGVANLQEPISTNSSSSNSAAAAVTSPRKLNSHNTDNLSLSSSSGSAFTVPVPANSGGPVSNCWHSFAGSCCDDYEWVSVDGSEEDRPIGFNDDFVWGPVPSIDEVHNAVTALTQAFGPPSHSQLIRDKFAYNVDKDFTDQIPSPTLLPQVPSACSELDWREPSPLLCNPKSLHPYGSQRVHEAFRLLQTEPSVQKMVVSITSDKAVWDAVMNNAVVRELRETFYADENSTPPTSESSDETGEESNPALNIVKWIFDSTRAKVMEVIETITKLVNELFKPPADEKTAGSKDPFEEKLRSSFLLSIMVLLIVVVTRAQRA